MVVIVVVMMVVLVMLVITIMIVVLKVVVVGRGINDRGGISRSCGNGGSSGSN
jgi:hypothetical protein